MPCTQRNAQFKHYGKDNFTLNVPEFSAAPGELVAVVGRVGAGKSSLIHAVLGNMQPTSGHAETGGRVSYVPQNPWCQNLTLRENILFGLPFDEEKYERVSKLSTLTILLTHLVLCKACCGTILQCVFCKLSTCCGTVQQYFPATMARNIALLCFVVRLSKASGCCRSILQFSACDSMLLLRLQTDAFGWHAQSYSACNLNSSGCNCNNSMHLLASPSHFSL